MDEFGIAGTFLMETNHTPDRHKLMNTLRMKPVGLVDYYCIWQMLNQLLQEKLSIFPFVVDVQK